MRGSACRTSAVAAAMLVASWIPALAQDYDGREKLRAQSNGFRKEVIRVTDGVYVAVGFDGNATKLYPLPEKDRAAKLVGLLGGTDAVVARGREALGAREFTWAAELADYVLANDAANAVAKRIKAQALIELGERQINAIARNYYLSSAMYLLKDLPPQR